MTINSPAELIRRFSEIQGVVPNTPFKMQDVWIIPDTDGAPPHTYKDAPDQEEIFSPSPGYVASLSLSHDNREASAARRISVHTLGGKLLWEGQTSATSISIADSGIVINRYESGNTTSLEFIGPDGRVISKADNVLPTDKKNSIQSKVLSKRDLLLVWNKREIVAFHDSGAPQWRYSLAVTDAESVIADAGLDPLDRGIYVVIIHRNQDSSVELLNVETGATTGAVWRHQLMLPPQFFSDGGHYASCVEKHKIRIIDWAKGVYVLKRGFEGAGLVDSIHGTEWSLTETSSGSVADTIPRVAVTLDHDLGISIFEAPRRRIWSCHIDAKSSRSFLSKDGTTLGVAVTDTSPNRAISINSLAMYKIDKSS